MPGHLRFIISLTAAIVCGSSYTEFNDFYYKILPAKSAKNAEAACQLECGHLSSIHSREENDLVRSLFGESEHMYAFIGGESSNIFTFQWYDEPGTTSLNYTNFGHASHGYGKCVAMALKNDVVKRGEWINTPCDNYFTSVCKRPRDNACSPSVSKMNIALHAAASDSLSQCPTQYYGGERVLQVWSPGWPSNYSDNLECEYIFTAPDGFIVLFGLLETDDYFNWPDPASNLSLYNSSTDTEPFLPRLYYGMPIMNTFYGSTTSSMKVKFTSGSSNVYRWSALYYPVDMSGTGCNQGILRTPGNISSPGYSGVYPSLYRCDYQLEAPANQRILLEVKSLTTIGFGDYVTVYDGPNTDAFVITKYPSSTFGFRAASTTNEMLVTFTTNYRNSSFGFTANFSAF